MTQYTELLDKKVEELLLDDDHYEDRLLEVASLFRGFEEALTSFIKEHGYTGDLSDIPAKMQFVRIKFKAAHIKSPRNLFVPNRKISRQTAFQICFALGLDADETKDFFRRVQFERGFDCHTINEAVYYFCMRKGLSYDEAQEIISSIPIPEKMKKLPDDVLYTGTIIENLNKIDDQEELIQYIKENIDEFRYNNVTALKYIKDLWYDISKEEGLAVQEGIVIDSHNRSDNKQEQEDDYVIAKPHASTWTIFSQIMGLRNYQESELGGIKYDRSLFSVLSDNRLMPLKAEYCFPNRQNIDKLLREELVGEDEIIRKMLIFLVFYTYWAKRIIRKKRDSNIVEDNDFERCLDMINARLLGAGYPELYIGNPYDWLFMWALKDYDNPLFAFRYYMGEVFAEAAEN